MYWQIFLVQRVCCGLGNGLLFFLMLAIISTYFSKRKSLAVGICTCGGATGGLIFPAIIQQPIPVAGYRWIMRALGSVTLACVTTSNILARPRVPPRRQVLCLNSPPSQNPHTPWLQLGCFLNFGVSILLPTSWDLSVSQSLRCLKKNQYTVNYKNLFILIKAVNLYR